MSNYTFNVKHRAKVQTIAGSGNPCGLGETILNEMRAKAHKSGFGDENDMLMDDMIRKFNAADRALTELREAARKLGELHENKAEII